MKILFILSIFFIAHISYSGKSNSCNKKEYSNVIREKGYIYLQHKTTLDKISSIIKTGMIVPFGSIAGQTQGCAGVHSDRVFFDPTKHKTSPNSIEYHSSSYSCVSGQENGDLKHATFVFDPKILDESSDFHISSCGWINYGDFDPLTDYDCSEPLTNLRTMPHIGEIVIKHSVPLKHLTSIFVHPSIKDEVVKKLKEKKELLSVNGSPVHDYINRVN